MKLGASASWRSNTLRFTTTIVSIVGGTDWAVRRSGGQALSNPSTMPTPRPPVPQTAAVLLDQVNALVQRVGHVASGVVPLRKIQGRVHAAGDLPQAARREREGAADRVRLQGAAQAGHRRVGGEARGRWAQRVRDVWPQVVRAPQVQREGERVLVSFADGGIEVVSRQAHIAPTVRRVDRYANEGERGVRLHHETSVPFPAGGALEAQRVVGARHTVAGAQQEHRQAEASRGDVAQKRPAKARKG